MSIFCQDYRDLRYESLTVSSPSGCSSTLGLKLRHILFDVVDRNLKPNSRFLLHHWFSISITTSTRGLINIYSPNGCLPSVRHIADASEAFVMEDWHNFGADYDTTLMAWYDVFLPVGRILPITIQTVSNVCLPII